MVWYLHFANRCHTGATTMTMAMLQLNLTLQAIELIR